MSVDSTQSEPRSLLESTRQEEERGVEPITDWFSPILSPYWLSGEVWASISHQGGLTSEIAQHNLFVGKRTVYSLTGIHLNP